MHLVIVSKAPLLAFCRSAKSSWAIRPLIDAIFTIEPPLAFMNGMGEL